MSLHLRDDVRRFTVDAFLLVLVYTAAAAFARFYVGGERFFYYWDYAVHHDIALRTADAFRTLGLADAFYTVYQSTADDYNAIFAIPLLPLQALLGESRVAYVIGLTLVYQVPFFLALGSVAVRLIPSSPRLVFWSTVAIAFVTPMSWVPTLRGFPDVGAAALVALATRLYLEGPRLEGRSHTLTIGVLLALAILFRRPFLFAAIAFFSAMGVQAIGRIVVGHRHDSRGAVRELTTALARIGVAGIATVATLLLVGHQFLIRILTHDFQALYTGYEVATSEVIAWYVAPYGIAACLAAGLGFVLGLRGRVTDRPATAFLALFAVLSLLQWLLVVRQLGEQYTLHFTPFMVFGCSILGWTLIRAGGDLIRMPALGTAAACLVCNLFFGLSGHRAVYQPTPFRAAFAANWPPLRRPDYDEMRRLVELLHEWAGEDQPLFVAASSHTINPDMVAHAEQKLFGRSRVRLKVLKTPAIDTGDVYPLETLLQAGFVVLAHPFQHHVDPEQQRVVRVVLDLFDTGRDLAQDFEALPGGYGLEGGVVATVWRRSRPTSDAVAVRSLRYIREAVGHAPGMQPDWIVLSALYPSHAERTANDTWKLLTHPTKRDTAPEARWLYIHESGDELRVTGRVHMIFGVCPGITLAFSVTDERGTVTPLGEVSRRQEDDGAFTLDLRPGRGRWLILRAMSPPWRDSIHSCLTWIEHVQVTGVSAP